MANRLSLGVILWAVPRFRRPEQPSIRENKQHVLAAGLTLLSSEPKLRAEPVVPEGNIALPAPPIPRH